MNAETLINAICESPKDVIFAYVPRLTAVYGVGCPPNGKEDPFLTWIKVFLKTAKLPADYRETALARPDEFIDILIKRHSALFILTLGGEVSVFCRSSTPKGVPKEFLAKVERFLDITPATPVGWYPSVTTAAPQDSNAAETIFGVDPNDLTYESARPGTAKDIVDKLLQ